MISLNAAQTFAEMLAKKAWDVDDAVLKELDGAQNQFGGVLVAIQRDLAERQILRVERSVFRDDLTFVSGVVHRWDVVWVPGRCPDNLSDFTHVCVVKQLFFKRIAQSGRDQVATTAYGANRLSPMLFSFGAGDSVSATGWSFRPQVGGDCASLKAEAYALCCGCLFAGGKASRLERPATQCVAVVSVCTTVVVVADERRHTHWHTWSLGAACCIAAQDGQARLETLDGLVVLLFGDSGRRGFVDFGHIIISITSNGLFDCHYANVEVCDLSGQLVPLTLLVWRQFALGESLDLTYERLALFDKLIDNSGSFHIGLLNR